MNVYESALEIGGMVRCSQRVICARKTGRLSRSGDVNKHADSKAPTSDTQAETTQEEMNNHYEIVRTRCSASVFTLTHVRLHTQHALITAS